MVSLESLLLAGSLLVLLSIGLMRAFNNVGIPTLILFVAVGILAGSEGLGSIDFENYDVAKSIGIVALVIILFSGGLDMSWKAARPVIWQAVSLSTLGVIFSTVFMAAFAHYALGLPPLYGFLLGAIVSSTDAAAVFSVFRMRRQNLQHKLGTLLEIESGCNDPMAVFLTLATLAYLQDPHLSWADLPLRFVRQMGLGLACGFALGKALVFVMNRLRFTVEGLYPVAGLAFAFLAYSATEALHGSGFMAVYLCGLVAGSSTVVHKRTLSRFFDGMAWLGQIVMFVVMGLLVFPSRLLPMVPAGLMLSAFLILAARPSSVFLSLLFSKLGINEKAFISWVGLRGAVPIVLAIFPLLAGLPQAETLFNLTFFLVLTSTALQGWSLPTIARWLKVVNTEEDRRKSPLEFAPPQDSSTELVEFALPFNSLLAGKSVVELNLPEDALVVLVCRGEEFLVPSGGTVLEERDAIQVLVGKDSMPKVREIFSLVRDG